MWYTAFGAIVTISVALVTSLIWGLNKNDDIDLNLISPVIRPLFRKPNSVSLFKFTSKTIELILSNLHFRRLK